MFLGRNWPGIEILAETGEVEETTPEEEELHVSREQLRNWQREDSELEEIRGKAGPKGTTKIEHKIDLGDGILYRVVKSECVCRRRTNGFTP